MRGSDRARVPKFQMNPALGLASSKPQPWRSLACLSSTPGDEASHHGLGTQAQCGVLGYWDDPGQFRPSRGPRRHWRGKPLTTMEGDVPSSPAMSCTTWKSLECCKQLLHLERPWFDARKSTRAHLPSTSSQKQQKRNPLRLFTVIGILKLEESGW